MGSTPEELARQKIDTLLAQAGVGGWQVQDYKAINIAAARGVAVREFPLKGAGEADYLLYADGRALGIVEAKPEGHTLTGVELQSAKYTTGFPDALPSWRTPASRAVAKRIGHTRTSSVCWIDGRAEEANSPKQEP